jgi:hypothetical protein
VAWVLAVPALHQASPERPSHVDVPSRAASVLSQGLMPLEGFTWHGYSRCLLYIKRAPSDLLTSMSLRGLLSFGAKGSCRSRVLRGMGARGACFTSSRSRASLSRRCPFEGCLCLEPGVRAARGFCVAWVPAVPALLQAGPGRPSHADIPSRVVFVSSRGFAPLEGSPCLARDRVIKCLTVEAAVLQRGRAFLGVVAARARVVGGVAGGRDGSPRSLRVFAVMMARLR